MSQGERYIFKRRIWSVVAQASEQSPGLVVRMPVFDSQDDASPTLGHWASPLSLSWVLLDMHPTPPPLLQPVELIQWCSPLAT